MKVTEFNIKGPLLIEPKRFGDSRGFFLERFRKDLFLELGLPDFIQDNYSRSEEGVLRGLHFQYNQPQGKLVTTTRGVIYDVAVDIRKLSSTFGKNISVELHDSEPSWLWVPPGFAHGFQVLSQEGADVLYKVNAPYNSDGEGGISWKDPALAINWPNLSPKCSDRDDSLPSWGVYVARSRF